MPVYVSPICCVVGHVDSGKTSFLDRIRNTKVQKNEASGITQQIGATYFSKKTLAEMTKIILHKDNIKIPGILMMDTPGHELFNNMRLQGQNLCQMAILTIDIMHGVQKQTVECIKSLKEARTPFVIILTKIDRINGWKETDPLISVSKMLDKQDGMTAHYFWSQISKINMELIEHEINAELFHLNKDFKKNVSMIPVSNITGSGIPDLFKALIGLIQKYMENGILYREQFQASIMETKKLDGVGYTADIILTGGSIKLGQEIYVPNGHEMVKTKVKRIYIPKTGCEIRGKVSELSQIDEARSVCCVKIFAEGLKDALSGMEVCVDEGEKYRIQRVCDNFQMADLEEIGIHLQTNSIGSMVSLLSWCNSRDIKIASRGLGTLTKNDIIRASVQLEKTGEKPIILAFNVSIPKEFADNNNIVVINSDHIYTIINKYDEYIAGLEETKKLAIKEKYKNSYVELCKLKFVSGCIFRASNPLIVGVKVVDGKLKKNVKIRTKDKEIGTIKDIQCNGVSVSDAKIGDEIAIKIETHTKNISFQSFQLESLPIYTVLKPHNLEAIYAVGTDWTNLLTEIEELPII